MPDSSGNLIPSDVEAYTQGRLLASDPETLRALNVALGALRRYCGWHVSPVLQETITLDGNGLNELILPTLKVVSIDTISVFDPGANTTTTIDVSDPTQFSMSSEIPGAIYMGGWGRWTWGHGNVTVQYTHGFDDAYDWQGAALELVDRMSAQVGTVVGASGPLSSKKVDDVAYQWMRLDSLDPGVRMFDSFNHAFIDRYRILPFA